MAGALIGDLDWRILFQSSSFTWADKLVLVDGGKCSHSLGGPLQRTTQLPRQVCSPPPKWIIQERLYFFNDLASEVTCHPFHYNLFIRSKPLSPAFFNWARDKWHFVPRPIKQTITWLETNYFTCGLHLLNWGTVAKNLWIYFKITVLSI